MSSKGKPRCAAAQCDMVPMRQRGRSARQRCHDALPRRFSDNTHKQMRDDTLAARRQRGGSAAPPAPRPALGVFARRATSSRRASGHGTHISMNVDTLGGRAARRSGSSTPRSRALPHSPPCLTWINLFSASKRNQLSGKKLQQTLLTKTREKNHGWR